jgi:hypothetical protein
MKNATLDDVLFAMLSREIKRIESMDKDDEEFKQLETYFNRMKETQALLLNRMMKRQKFERLFRFVEKNAGTLIPSLTQVAIVLLILNYEQKDTITSKAFSLLRLK